MNHYFDFKNEIILGKEYNYTLFFEFEISETCASTLLRFAFNT